MGSFKWLKKLDMWKAPVKMFIHRYDKKKNKKVHIGALGTKCGGMLAILAIFIFTFSLITLLVDMYSGEKDSLKKNTLVNNFDSPNKQSIDM